jgi:hypothetical protein
MLGRKIVSAVRGRRTRSWTQRISTLGFAFFFVKGMVWMILPLAVWLID